MNVIGATPRMQASWHFSTTRRIALELGLSKCEALSLSIGDISVDLRHWKRDSAHGMTPMDPRNGRPAIDLEVAEAAWRDWICSCAEKAFSLADTPDTRHSALYFFGMALHALQDREAHQGMTIAEHARRFLLRDDPDTDSEALQRGQAVTIEVLHQFQVRGRENGWPTCLCGRRTTYWALADAPDGASLDIDLQDYMWQGIKWLRASPPRVRWPRQESR